MVQSAAGLTTMDSRRTWNQPEVKWQRLILALSAVTMVTTSVKAGEETSIVFGSRVFRDAGVVWMEERNGDYILQHMFMNTVTTGVSKPQPEPIAMMEPGHYNFSHIDLDHENKLFVMSEPLTRKIIVISYDEYFTHIQYDLYVGTSNQVNGITIDWKTNVVYWTDAMYDVIQAVSLTFPHAAVVIVTEGLEEPGDIAVHPNKGYLFWTESSPTRPRLMRSGLAGENVQDLILFNARRPSTLFMDFNDDRLYWRYTTVDNVAREGIGSCDVNGNALKYHTTRDITFFGINVFYERVLLAGRERGTNKSEILILDRNGSGEPVAKIPVKGRLLMMHVLDSTRQLDTRNPCYKSMCPGVCIVSNKTEKCFCSPLANTGPDAEYVCEPAPPFHGLLFAKYDGLYTVKTNFAEYKNLQYLDRPVLSLVVPSQHVVKAVTSDVRNNRIYFFESKTKVIKSVSTLNDSTTEAVSLAVADVGGLAFDWLRNNLYWTDKEYGHVIVAKATGDFPFVLVRNVDKPMAIAVHPFRKMIFWSCKCVGLLERTYLDGTFRRTLAPAWNRNVTAIAVDFTTDSVLLTTENEILMMDPFGNEVTFVYKDAGRRFSGITIFHDYMLVTDTSWTSSALIVFRRVTGSFRKHAEVSYPFFDYGNWYGVVFHHVSSQPIMSSSSERLMRTEDDPCVQLDGYCDQVCVTATRPECLCTLGYIRNGTTCQIGEPFRQFLILSDQRQRSLLQLDANVYYSIPVQVLAQPHKVAFDPVKNMVYWTDLDSGTISRSQLNGDNQEIIILNSFKYFLNMVIVPEYRLLFYLVRPRDRTTDRTSNYWDESPNLYSQMMVYHLDTGKVTYFNRVLEEPRGLAINKEYGYVFLTDLGSIWRSLINESQFIDLIPDHGQTSLLATSGEYLYFAKVRAPNAPYWRPRTQLAQCSLDGTNCTVLHDFIGDHMTSLAVHGGIVYWGNSSTRAIHSASVSNVVTMETLGPTQMLFQPTGIYVHPPGTTTVHVCQGCDGYVCLPSVDGKCTKYTAESPDLTWDNSYRAPCRVSAVQYGEIRGNKAGNLVPDGYVARVQCFPVHRSTHPYPLTCRNSQWAPIPPDCILEYDICGTPSRGYKIFTQSGKYFVYPESTNVHVIVIGGGGGGYDVMNKNITANRKAGDGGISSFGTHISALGGFGGTQFNGGTGGRGERRGEQGQMRPDCSTGGTAGYGVSNPVGPGSTWSRFAGTGGYSFNCSGDQIALEVGTVLGEVSIGPQAGRFGGGAGSRGGGPGGGGAWKYLAITKLRPREVVPVTVGTAGSPSFGKPGGGAVIVRWGNIDFEKFPEHDFIDGGCLPNL